MPAHQLPKAALRDAFNPNMSLPWSLRISDFQAAMSDVNSYLAEKGLQRLDDMMRPAGLSGMLSDMLTDAMGKHSRVLRPNLRHNGHPDLVVDGHYPDNEVEAGEDGIEVKSTSRSGGAVDTHGARNMWMCVFVYTVDNDASKPVWQREPLTFREVYLADVKESDFRLNGRKTETGTRTATLHAAGLKKMRTTGTVYLDKPPTARERSGSWRAAQRPRKARP